MEDEEEGELVPDPDFREIWRDKKRLLHRLNGPAIVHLDGDSTWYYHGAYHREDGPARDWPTGGLEEWYKHGEKYEPSAHELMVWKMKKKEW